MEGTGSMVLDRENKIAYACISKRTDKDLFSTFCTKMGYTPILFHAADQRGNEIYHTNVLMCMASDYVVICLDTLYEEEEKKLLLEQFKSNHKEVIEISQNQMEHFCGNMLQVRNSEGKPFLVMSTQAFTYLEPTQLKKLEAIQGIQMRLPFDVNFN